MFGTRSGPSLFERAEAHCGRETGILGPKDGPKTNLGGYGIPTGSFVHEAIIGLLGTRLEPVAAAAAASCCQSQPWPKVTRNGARWF